MSSLKSKDFNNLLHENEVVCNILHELQSNQSYFNSFAILDVTDAALYRDRISKYLALRAQIQSQLAHYVRHNDFHIKKKEEAS